MRQPCLTGPCLLLLTWLVGCGPRSETEVAFRNVTPEVNFTGDESCASCHEEQFIGFQSHGMAHSFYPIAETSDSLWLDAEAVVVHHATGLRYRVFRESDSLFQEETAPDLVSRADALVRRADFVVGSGNTAATFLTAQNGRLLEMPVSWYAQGSRWDFSPGYRRSNARFDRQIPDRCMACHNSYPATTPWIDGKYTSLPNGIGCERCHGPGELHVSERLEVPDPPSRIDDSIVNPKHLELDRRLAVCEQCHLQTTVSVLRRGRQAFDFRPSEQLSDHVALFFDPTESSAESTIPVISHAERMQRSACFTKTQATARPLECVTCHDPHEGFRDKGPQYFNMTCLSCHVPDTLVATVTQTYREDHTPDAHCFSCHMPRREADDAPHASFTDHWIRSDGGMEPTATPSTEPLLPYFDRDKNNREGQAYLGMALIVHGRQTNDPRKMASGVATLEAGLQTDSAWSEAHFLRGVAYHQLGRPDLGVGALELAVRLQPESPQHLDALAQAYEALHGSPSKILPLYRKALAIQPALADVRANYALALQRNGDLTEAITEYRASLAEIPWNADVHVLLGAALLQGGKSVAAGKAFEEAAHLNPFLTEVLRNIVLVSLAGSESASITLFDGLDGTPANSTTGIVRPAPVGLITATGAPARAMLALPSGSTGRILTSRGERVATVTTNPITGGAPWDLTDEAGATIPSGIYLLQTRSASEAGRGSVQRFVVVNMRASQ